MEVEEEVANKVLDAHECECDASNVDNQGCFRKSLDMHLSLWQQTSDGVRSDKRFDAFAGKFNPPNEAPDGQPSAAGSAVASTDNGRRLLASSSTSGAPATQKCVGQPPFTLTKTATTIDLNVCVKIPGALDCSVGFFMDFNSTVKLCVYGGCSYEMIPFVASIDGKLEFCAFPPTATAAFDWSVQFELSLKFGVLSEIFRIIMEIVQTSLQVLDSNQMEVFHLARLCTTEEPEDSSFE